MDSEFSKENESCYRVTDGQDDESARQIDQRNSRFLRVVD